MKGKRNPDQKSTYIIYCGVSDCRVTECLYCDDILDAADLALELYQPLSMYVHLESYWVIELNNRGYLPRGFDTLEEFEDFYSKIFNARERNPLKKFVDLMKGTSYYPLNT